MRCRTHSEAAQQVRPVAGHCSMCTSLASRLKSICEAVAHQRSKLKQLNLPSTCDNEQIAAAYARAAAAAAAAAAVAAPPGRPSARA